MNKAISDEWFERIQESEGDPDELLLIALELLDEYSGANLEVERNIAEQRMLAHDACMTLLRCQLRAKLSEDGEWVCIRGSDASQIADREEAYFESIKAQLEAEERALHG